MKGVPLSQAEDSDEDGDVKAPVEDDDGSDDEDDEVKDTHKLEKISEVTLKGTYP